MEVSERMSFCAKGEKNKLILQLLKNKKNKKYNDFITQG